MAKAKEKTEMLMDEAIEIFVKDLKREWPANYAAFNKRLKAFLKEIGEDDACIALLLDFTTGEIKFDSD